MSEFTASNGIPVIPDESGGYQFSSVLAQLGITGISGMHAEALRQFFVKENDDRLGRWRWPYVGNRNVVVYPLKEYPDRVLVIDETTGTAVYRHRGEEDERFKTAETEAAAAYFDAHPESKPWRDAKPGETWRLTVNDRQPDDIELTFNVIGVEGIMRSRFARPQISGEQMEYAIDSPAIVAGRCIWPEVQS